MDGPFTVIDVRSRREFAQGSVPGGIPVGVMATVAERVARIMREYRPQEWTDEERAEFLACLALMVKRLGPARVASLRSTFEDGRFAAVGEGLLVDYYGPLYHASSVEGRNFVLELATGPDPVEDARRLTAAIAQALLRSESVVA